MHQLLLMRHAKAVRASAGLPDHSRALAPQGIEAAARMRQTLHELGFAPDVILVSSAKRTQETLIALEPWDDRPNIEVLDTLYMATAARLLDSIRETRETVRSVMVIGHNPGLHELALALAGPKAPAPLLEHYPTASLTEFTVLTPWQAIKPAMTRFGCFIQPGDTPSGPR